jgi:hypothetical protein
MNAEQLVEFITNKVNKPIYTAMEDQEYNKRILKGYLDYIDTNMERILRRRSSSCTTVYSETRRKNELNELLRNITNMILHDRTEDILGGNDNKDYFDNIYHQIQDNTIIFNK